ncbi:MAG: hypothetical protein ACUZ8E_05700 [Candidatus Anammoxibacter sp.]
MGYVCGGEVENRIQESEACPRMLLSGNSHQLQVISDHRAINSVVGLYYKGYLPDVISGGWPFFMKKLETNLITIVE